MKVTKKLTAFLGSVALLLIGGPGFASPPDHANGNPPDKFPWGPFEELGIPFVFCGDFWINIDWRGEGFWTTHYDKDGSIKFEFFLGKDTYLFWYNSENPSIGFLSHGTKINRHWDDEPFQGEVAEVGLSFRLNVPGYGVVFQDVGRLVYNWDTGEVLFSAGPHNSADVLWGDSTLICSIFSG